MSSVEAEQQAPQVRKAPGKKVTIGEAYRIDVEEDRAPMMPHLTYSEEELKQLYPPLEPPEAADADDPLNDEDDALVAAGNVLIKELVEATARQGRRRRMAAK